MATYKRLVLQGTGQVALEHIVSPQDFEPPDIIPPHSELPWKVV